MFTPSPELRQRRCERTMCALVTWYKQFYYPTCPLHYHVQIVTMIGHSSRTRLVGTPGMGSVYAALCELKPIRTEPTHTEAEDYQIVFIDNQRQGWFPTQ